MAGNEIEVSKYLVSMIGLIDIPHLGRLQSVGAPILGENEFEAITRLEDVESRLSTENSRKKADIYINSRGVSVKQVGPSFLYNRLQRTNMIQVFNLLGFPNPNNNLNRLDIEIRRFHDDQLDCRNRPWTDFFTESEFKPLLKYLMMDGSPNIGRSTHPAEFILEAPVLVNSVGDISVFTFDEYFVAYREHIKIAIRRQWYGQASNSEHKRAKGLIQKTENRPWVFNSVSGTPRIHKTSGLRWRENIPENERKTVFILMIEKER